MILYLIGSLLCIPYNFIYLSIHLLNKSFFEIIWIIKNFKIFESNPVSGSISISLINLKFFLYTFFPILTLPNSIKIELFQIILNLNFKNVFFTIFFEIYNYLILLKYQFFNIFFENFILLKRMFLNKEFFNKDNKVMIVDELIYNFQYCKWYTIEC